MDKIPVKLYFCYFGSIYSIRFTHAYRMVSEAIETNSANFKAYGNLTKHVYNPMKPSIRVGGIYRELIIVNQWYKPEWLRFKNEMFNNIK